MEQSEQAQTRNNAPQSEVSLSRPLPPTLLRIYADNQDKKSMCFFWCIFFIVIIIITGASFGLPEEVVFFNNKSELHGTELEGCLSPAAFNERGELECYNGTDRQGVLMFDLERENQFVVIFLNFLLIDGEKDFKQQQFDVKLSLYEIQITRNGKSFKQVEKTQTKDWKEEKLHPELAIQIYGKDDETLLGYSFPLYALRNFNDQSFVLIIETQPDLTDIPNVDKVEPKIMVVNPEFTTYSIVIRYVFFVLSVIGLFVYVARYRKIPQPERIVEQKMILILSILLIMFNDPLYSVTVLFPNKASSYFSVMFLIDFVIFLIFLWIVFIDRIFYEDGQKKTELFNWKRVLYIVILYILTLILYTELALDHIEGLPIVETQEITTNKFLGLEVLVILLIVCAFVYIFIQYIRICTRVDEKLWRNQLYMFFSIFFLFVTLVMFFVNGFHIYDTSGDRILFLFTSMNMYTFYMQYMYSVTSEERDRIQRGKIYGQRPAGGFGLLENGSDGDCVDLEFKDMIDPNQQVFKQKESSNASWEKNEQRGKEMRLEENGDRLEEIETDKQTDFFEENSFKEEEFEEKKEVKGKEEDKKQFQVFELE